MKIAWLMTAAFAALLWNCSSREGEKSAVAPTAQCRLCHEAPPRDRIHTAHSVTRDYDCGLCHPGYVRHADGRISTSEAYHANGDTDVVFSQALLPLGNAIFDKTSKTCQTVYCHGFFSGGDSASVKASDTIAITRCAACHDLQSMMVKGHPPHTPDNVSAGTLTALVGQCENCHTGYSLNNSLVNGQTHINGAVEAVGDEKCRACHTVPSHDSTRTPCTRCHVR